MDNDLDHSLSRYHLLRSLVIIGIFLASIGISFFSTTAAILSWVLLALADTVALRLWRPRVGT